MSLPPALVLDEITKSYPGPGVVLDRVSIRIEPGELVGIVGPSGSGKSTLLHIMGTLDSPTSGSVRIAGHDVSSSPDDELAAIRAQEIGFIFQSFFLIDGLSALDNVANGLLYRGLPIAERRRAATKELERVGMSHRLDHVPAQLSGGERQRVAVARALIGAPSLVLADEPTGNLDSAASKRAMDSLRALNDEGVTIVVITHDPKIAASLPRTIEILDGRIVADDRMVA
ncbi:MAG TPA: ABC transporter ATP-binding protein [Solirubrobacterales bacterium]|nr:ABC transporter ATP-binding protein [Solirubrobacterales bacterium]